MEAWGKLSKSQILKIAQKDDFEGISSLITSIDDGLKNYQEAEEKFKRDLDVVIKSNDQLALKNLNEKEAERKSKESKHIQEITQAIKDYELKNEKSKLESESFDGKLYSEFSKLNNYEKIKDVVSEEQFYRNLDNREEDTKHKVKNDQEMTKLFAKEVNNFSQELLPLEHAKTVDAYLKQLRVQSLFLLITHGDYSKVIPMLNKDRDVFINFLKKQFNSEVIQMCQVGRDLGYKAIKRMLSEIFKHLQSQDHENNFLMEILHSHIFRNGFQCAQKLITKNNKVLKTASMFMVESEALTGLNPYFLVFMTRQLIKIAPEVLLKTKFALANMINLLILNGLLFRSDKKIALKLLKGALKMIYFAYSHCKELCESKEIANIIQNDLLKNISAGIPFDNDKMSEQCIVCCEMLMLVDVIQQDSGSKYGHYVANTI